MTVLEKIIAYKRKETEERKRLYPLALLERSPYYEAECVSMRRYLQRPDKSGVIAEFKRKSPSAVFNQHAVVEDVSIGYMQAGASALSILTDDHFFGGCGDDLEEARTFNFCPILRKDFICDPYQVYESRAMGADCILLIADVLTKQEVRLLADLSHQLGMESILEVSSEEGLQKWTPEVDILGVNNRNLHTMECNIERSVSLATLIADFPLTISESGISCAEDILRLGDCGYTGFLVGSIFMREADPAAACRRLIRAVENQKPEVELTAMR